MLLSVSTRIMRGSWLRSAAWSAELSISGDGPSGPVASGIGGPAGELPSDERRAACLRAKTVCWTARGGVVRRGDDRL